MIALFACVLAAALYLLGVRTYRRRFPGRAFSVWRVAAFLAGDAILVAALSPQADAASEASFAAHMFQHVVLWLVAPPLMLLGAPLLVLVGALPTHAARRFTHFADSGAGRALFSPITAWLLYVFVLWGAHFSPLYEAALEHPAVHALEHALFLAVAFLFWGTVVQVGYVPRPLGFAPRAFMLFFTIPQGAFLGFALGASRDVLYASYLHRWGSVDAALLDQHNGADVMWILGGFILFVAFMCTAGAWASHEHRSAVAAGVIICAFLLPARVHAQGQYNGADLYMQHCASCHGTVLEGSRNGPPLLRVDTAMVDFMLRTGRMPAGIPWDQNYRQRPQLTPPQIAAVEDFIMTRSLGAKSLPHVMLPPAGYGLRKGRELFQENCQQCHGAGGQGNGAVGYHNVAPEILDDTPLEIAEAVREGPDVMPRFGSRTIDDEQLGNLIAYIGFLQHGQYNPGGMQLKNIGPVAEGFVAWTFGLGLLVLLIRRIGTTD
ncbi:MAG TPA: cytochrome c oxidase assembly protein [Candidatus Baltobacteraceae bacterium]|nr:cytochrome c oxidase assembly protein [Candidatus Baltobacteraceae bacterium]